MALSMDTKLQVTPLDFVLKVGLQRRSEGGDTVTEVLLEGGGGASPAKNRGVEGAPVASSGPQATPDDLNIGSISNITTTSGHGDHQVAVLVTNTSPSGNPVAYRLLTTEKRGFTVSPREGILAVGATQTVLIALSGAGLRGLGEFSVTDVLFNAATGGTASDGLSSSFGPVTSYPAPPASSSASAASSSDVAASGDVAVYNVPAVFKLEYKGLGPADTEAVDLIASGKGTATTISDLIKSNKKERKSTLLNCNVYYYCCGSRPAPATVMASNAAKAVPQEAVASGSATVAAITSPSPSPARLRDETVADAAVVSAAVTTNSDAHVAVPLAKSVSSPSPPVAEATPSSPHATRTCTAATSGAGRGGGGLFSRVKTFLTSEDADVEDHRRVFFLGFSTAAALAATVAFVVVRSTGKSAK